jgi:cobalt/nickel transport system permease protein
MHMADALISPAVGATMWAASGGLAVYSARKVREEGDAAKVPLMGVVGAFVFATQMLNFTIPGTGSSGHLGGGLILAILLGPEAAFLVMASVLTVQALFFADGGLLALGCNIFNLGFFPAFVAYPLVYKKIVGNAPSTSRLVTGSIAGALAGLGLGALGVVLQTTLSGVSELPFPAFVTLMLPIHLAIGLVEGLVTAAVVLFVNRTQPEILSRVASGAPMRGLALRNVLVGLAVAAVLAGSVFAWFASADPDGLEWSVAGVTGSAELEAGGEPAYGSAAAIQENTALMPDYAFDSAEGAEEESGDAAWPAVDAGTSVAGLVGAALVMGAAVGLGWALSRRSHRPKTPTPDA